MSVLDLMLPSAAACIVLAGILCYFGTHIVARQVYFADLALAQMAAMGTAWGLAWGHEMGTPGSYLYSFGATLVGAVVFAWSRRFERKVAQEAVIGTTYVCAMAFMLLIMSHAPGGLDDIKGLLEGNLLTTGWSAIGSAALLSIGVGILHFVFRKQLFVISFHAGRMRGAKLNMPLWDFLFFATFGLVVTASVRIAGVLVVFSLLVVPAVIAAIFARTVSSRLALGWLLGVLLSVTGVALSSPLILDAATGPTVVMVLGAALFLLGLGANLLKKGGIRA